MHAEYIHQDPSEQRSENACHRDEHHVDGLAHKHVGLRYDLVDEIHAGWRKDGISSDLQEGGDINAPHIRGEKSNDMLEGIHDQGYFHQGFDPEAFDEFFEAEHGWQLNKGGDKYGNSHIRACSPDILDDLDIKIVDDRMGRVYEHVAGQNDR